MNKTEVLKYCEGALIFWKMILDRLERYKSGGIPLSDELHALVGDESSWKRVAAEIDRLTIICDALRESIENETEA